MKINKKIFKYGIPSGKHIHKPKDKITIGIINRLNLNGVVNELNDKLGKKYSGFILHLTLPPFLEEDINEYVGSLTAIAKCQDSDEYSEKIGENIVNTKLLYKYHLSMAKKYNQIIKNIKYVTDKCKELQREHLAYVAMYDEKLKKYL